MRYGRWKCKATAAGETLRRGTAGDLSELELPLAATDRPGAPQVGRTVWSGTAKVWWDVWYQRKLKGRSGWD